MFLLTQLHIFLLDIYVFISKKLWNSVAVICSLSWWHFIWICFPWPPFHLTSKVKLWTYTRSCTSYWKSKV